MGIGNQQPSPTQNGFSMLEMLVVLVILAMTMTMAPSILAGLQGSRLRAASDELVWRLRETRDEATRRSAATELMLDFSKLTVATISTVGFRPLPPIIDAMDVVPEALLKTGGIVRILFLADGTATEARIILRHGTASTAVVIDWLTGAVRRDG